MTALHHTCARFDAPALQDGKIYPRNKTAFSELCKSRPEPCPSWELQQQGKITAS